MFFKIGVLKNFTIFTRKYLCWNPFVIQLQFSSLATILKSNSSTGVFLWTLPNFKEHLFWKTFANGCFWNLMKLLFDHKILSFWTCYEEYLSCILLLDCTNTIVIRLKKQKSLNQISHMVLWIIQWDVSKNEILGGRNKKLVCQAGHVSDEGRSLLEINCILWT